MQTLRRTPLYDRHVALGARMVPFAGWEMPVQYEGVIPEHKAVRTDAGVFDVSHMGELEVEGPTARDLLQATLSNDVDKLEPGDAQYTLRHERGRRDRRRRHPLPARRAPVPDRRERVERETRCSTGSRSASCAARTCATSRTTTRCSPSKARARSSASASTAAKPFTWAMGELDGVEVMVNRTGYTGEEGVELACMADEAGQLWDAILARGVVPCGLGARDTLRLEVCYPLHGNDIGPELGRDLVRARLGVRARHGLHRRRAPARDQGRTARRRSSSPFVMTEKAIPRQGMPVVGGGEVTSGTMSPMLEVGIGMAYVPGRARRSRAPSS